MFSWCKHLYLYEARHTLIIPKLLQMSAEIRFHSVFTIISAILNHAFIVLPLSLVINKQLFKVLMCECQN